MEKKTKITLPENTSGFLSVCAAHVATLMKMFSESLARLCLCICSGFNIQGHHIGEKLTFLLHYALQWAVPDLPSALELRTDIDGFIKVKSFKYRD